MEGFFGHAERDLIKTVAHALPASIRRALDLIAEDIPPTPSPTIQSPDDDAAVRLQRVEHTVVLMQENPSFDHMLGSLSLPVEQGGRARANVDGLRGRDHNANAYDGS